MTKEEFDSLQVGDIIRHKTSSHGMIVVARYGKDSVIVTDTRTACNPDEWDFVMQAEYRRVEENPPILIIERKDPK